MNLKKKIACIILAAGKGRRFGMPKWQAKYSGKTFLEIIIEKVTNAGITDIACVIRNDSIPDVQNIKYAVNPDPERGMFSSLLYGINIFPKKQGYIIIPVDHPFFKKKTLQELYKVFETMENDTVVRPIYKKRAGHPIIIPGLFARNIPEGDYAGGLKKFIDDSNILVHNIVVDDQGVLRNINTVKDLQF